MRWQDPEQIPIPQAFRTELNLHPLVAKVLVKRGITNTEQARAYLNPQAYTPTPAAELPDLEIAANLVGDAIEQGRRILVWGDFDVDGQTSTTLLVEALHELGAQVDFHIPVRAVESHGISLPVLQAKIADGFDLLLTCDTGITAHEAVDYTRVQGKTAVITDHHQLPPTLPDAHAVVNSQRVPEGHPLHTLPGVGVAYKLVEELYERAGRSADCARFLDLVALGIVADVAEQTGDARYLLQRGLQVLRDTNRRGLLETFRLADVNPAFINETTIGFTIGPRMNALGRLADANPIVEYLTTEDPTRAGILATRLEALNAQRRLLTDQVLEGALAQIERHPHWLKDPALVIDYPHWPAGVIGIVASRLVERYNKPVILLTAPEDEPARGSARSVDGCDITRAIASQKDLLIGFGGHTMAAGMSLHAENIPAFRSGINRAVAEQIGDGDLEAELDIDAYLSPADIHLDLLAELEQLAPFGAGNPPLAFASRELNLAQVIPIGKTGDHLKLRVVDPHDNILEVLWWNGAGWPQPEGTFDLAYHARLGSFRGERQMQLEFVDFRVTEAPEPSISEELLEVIDHRIVRDPEHTLERVLNEHPQAEVWGEGSPPRSRDSHRRDQLTPADVLVVWNTPPSLRIYRQAIETVQPGMVVIFGQDSGMDQPKAFIDRLAGLIKYAILKSEGKTELATLAAATSQTQAAVRTGLELLAAQGHFSILEVGGGSLHFLLSVDEPGAYRSLAELQDDLRLLLKESAAFRAYFQKVSVEQLKRVHARAAPHR